MEFSVPATVRAVSIHGPFPPLSNGWKQIQGLRVRAQAQLLWLSLKKKRKMPLSLRYREKEGGRDEDTGVVCGGKEDMDEGVREFVCLEPAVWKRWV